MEVMDGKKGVHYGGGSVGTPTGGGIGVEGRSSKIRFHYVLSGEVGGPVGGNPEMEEGR